MKTFKDFLKESKNLNEETADEKYVRIVHENEIVFKDMDSVKDGIEKAFYKLNNAIAYGNKIKPIASQIEKDCKELISLSKKLKELN